MLKLKGISSAVNEIRESDYYIPINIKFENLDSSLKHNIYWRTGNFLEIGINAPSGAIVSIVLLLASKIFFNKKKEFISKNNESIGLPLFNIEKWKNDTCYLDEDLDKNFEVYVEKDKVIILLAPNDIILKIVNERVVFGFDNTDSLCMIEIKDINSAERKLLEERYNK